jgi:hypothetical protein
LINAEATGRDGEQSAVGRDSIPNRDGDYIAWDKLGGVDADNLAGSKYFCFVGRVFLESLRMDVRGESKRSGKKKKKKIERA